MAFEGEALPIYTCELVESNQPMVAPKLRIRIVNIYGKATKRKTVAKKSKTGRKKTVCPPPVLAVDRDTAFDEPNRPYETPLNVQSKITILEDIPVKTSIFVYQGKKIMIVNKIGCASDKPLMTIFLEQLTPDTAHPIIDLTDESDDMDVDQ